MNLSLNYAHDFSVRDGVVTASTQINANTPYFLSVWNTDCYTSVATGGEVCDNGDRVGPWATIDLNLRYTALRADWYVEAYGTNLTNMAYATFSRRNSADGVVGYAFNAPLQVGARAGARF